MLFSFLQAKLHGKVTEAKSLDPALVQAIQYHKLSGLLKDIFLSSQSHEIKKEYKSNWIRNTIFINFLETLDPPKELSGTLLKGMHLIHHYYCDRGERFLGDIDILIPKNRMKDWGEWLESKGLFRQVEKKWEANSFKQVYLLKKDNADGIINIELHTRLFYDEEKNLSWENHSSPYQNLFFLKEEELFVHLCGHLVYQHTFHNLTWLYDIALVVQRSNLDWYRVEALASKARVLRSCRLISLILSHYLNIPCNLQVDFFTKYFVFPLVTKKFLYDPSKSKLRYSLIKLLCKDKIWYGLKYYILWLRNYLRPKEPEELGNNYHK